jgi:hypothetical protein
VDDDDRGGPPTRLGAGLRRVLEPLLRRPQAERSLMVAAAWSRAVGPKIARAARPIRLVDGTLLVQVTSPTWRQELRMRSAEILAKLKRELGDAVRAIDVKVGVNPDLRPAGATEAAAAARAVMPRLAALARTLESPELRELALAVAEGRPLAKPAPRAPERVVLRGPAARRRGGRRKKSGR